MQQYDLLERMVVAQSELFTLVIGIASTEVRNCAKELANLRQKLTVLMQRQIPPRKSRKEDDDQGFSFEVNCAGSIHTDVDCDLVTFQEIARAVRAKLPTTHFRPAFTELLHPRPDIEGAEILFSSLGELAKIIGISSASDLMYMAIRERGHTTEKERSSGDMAIRILGTCVMDRDDDNSPTAMLTCQSMNEHYLSKEVDVLVRDYREFDFASRSYTHRLEQRKLTGESLIRVIFASELSNMDETQRLGRVRNVSSQLRSFGLCWHPIAPPNPRIWSRSVAVPETVNGILEIEVPFLIFRGPKVIQELKELRIASLVRELIEMQMVPDEDK